MRRRFFPILFSGGSSAPSEFTDSFDRADGAVGNNWLNTGVSEIINESAKLTPALSAELNTTANAASDPAGNEANGTSGTNVSNATWSVESTEKTTGSYSLKATSNVAANGRAEVNLPHVLNTWYRTTFNIKSGPHSNPSYPLFTKDWLNMLPWVAAQNGSADAWKTLKVVGRCTNATAMRMRFYPYTTGEYGFVDNISCKSVDFSHMHLARQWTNRATYNAYVKPNLPLNIPGGIFAEVDDYTNPQNGIYFVVNNYFATVWLLSSGVWSVLINDTLYTPLYSKKLEVRKSDATTYAFYYNGTQIGTNQTINNANLGSYFGPFLSGPEATCKEFYVGPHNATPPAETTINAANFLTTPTYDGAGQATHPDVLYFAGGWNSYKYWMAMTPYPDGDTTKENPSIIASNDGTTWVVPAGLTNPISGLPAGGTFFSDPDLFMSVDGLTMYCIYRWSDGSTTGKLYLRSSTDGTTWSAATEVWSGTNKELVSPAILWDGSQWVMWTVDVASSPFQIEKRTSVDLLTWSAASTCTITDINDQKDNWHLDVIYVNSRYEMFLCKTALGLSTLGELFFAYSTDGDAWTLDPNVVLSLGVSGQWDDARIYRTSPLYLGDNTYDLFYSGKKAAGNDWHIGRTTYTRS